MVPQHENLEKYLLMFMKLALSVSLMKETQAQLFRWQQIQVLGFWKCFKNAMPYMFVFEVLT